MTESQDPLKEIGGNRFLNIIVTERTKFASFVDYRAGPSCCLSCKWSEAFSARHDLYYKQGITFLLYQSVESYNHFLANSVTMTYSNDSCNTEEIV